jgi:hypothetical protein
MVQREFVSQYLYRWVLLEASSMDIITILFFLSPLTVHLLLQPDFEGERYGDDLGIIHQLTISLKNTRIATNHEVSTPELT